MSIQGSDSFKARANYSCVELRVWQSPVTSTTGPKTNSAKLKTKAYPWPLEQINRGQLEGKLVEESWAGDFLTPILKSCLI